MHITNELMSVIEKSLFDTYGIKSKISFSLKQMMPLFINYQDLLMIVHLSEHLMFLKAIWLKINLLLLFLVVLMMTPTL